MLWDGLFLVMAVILAVNGYNRGLIASWRGPIAIVLATVAVQQVYIDFAAWIAARLRVNPEVAVVVGYLMLWIGIEALIEILLTVVIKGGKQNRPGTFNRLGGVLYGLAKSVVIAILPLMAMQVDISIPQPPQDKSGLVVPEFAAVNGAFLIPGFKTIAATLVPKFGLFVVSTKAPSFKPDYTTPDLKNPSDTKSLQKDINNLLK